MITENVRKQLRDYKRHGNDLKYLINYIIGLVEDENDFEEIIIREMKALTFNEDEIVECLEYDFGLDMSWHPMSVNHGEDTCPECDCKETFSWANEDSKEMSYENAAGLLVKMGYILSDTE